MAYAILGPQGTFSEEAALLYWGEGVDLCLAPSIGELFSLLENGQAQGALLPLENSRAGTINQSMAGLEASCVSIRGEISIPVRQHLMAGKKYSLEEIELLISQPTALMQCEGFISQNMAGVRKEITDSTTGAAQLIKHESRKAACIGNHVASRVYGLEIIRRDIQDNHNLTRFIHVAAGDALPGQGEKSSLIFSLPDQPGSLYKALGLFAQRNLNLSKIESRPIKGKKAAFSFYIEVDTPEESSNLDEVMDELTDLCGKVKYLGSYNIKRKDTKSGGI